MALNKMSRTKQVALSGALALAMFVAGVIVFPRSAAACIPCDGQWTEWKCQDGRYYYRDCSTSGCYPIDPCNTVCSSWHRTNYPCP